MIITQIMTIIGWIYAVIWAFYYVRVYIVAFSNAIAKTIKTNWDKANVKAPWRKTGEFVNYYTYFFSPFHWFPSQWFKRKEDRKIARTVGKTLLKTIKIK